MNRDGEMVLVDGGGVRIPQYEKGKSCLRINRNGAHTSPTLQGHGPSTASSPILSATCIMQC